MALGYHFHHQLINQQQLRHDDPRLCIAWLRRATVLNPKDQQYALLTAGFEGVTLG